MALTAQTQVNSSTDLTTIVCGSCGGIYAIAERYRHQKHEQGGFWNCPYCRCSWGFGTSENARLKAQLATKEREVEQERKRKEWAQQEARVTERRRRALKGQITKVKKRIGHGVCPCCNRSFENLRRHMTTKHPAYAKAGAP
jgi:hypothetical protein